MAMTARQSFFSRAARVLASILLAPAFVCAGEPLVVHEWGTFTSLQDETGRALAGINVDDEPVPEFVHNLSKYILSPTFMTQRHWRFRMKAVPRHHPRVTLRLETPVIYFYPPASQTEPLAVDVSVRFRGGWLSEFYPEAEAEAPGIDWQKRRSFVFADLTPETVSSLSWSGLQVGTSLPGPATDEHVWTAPRQVRAASVSTPEGESEKYLFYRGVGNLEAPLRVTMDRSSRVLSVLGNFDEALDPRARGQGGSAAIPACWIASVREDGAVAFRTFGALKADADRDRVLATASYDFEDEDHTAANLGRLQSAMHRALVEAGLYSDEATAMLSTWQRAYFTSPGLRLFHLVPRAWTDHYLPLEISEPVDIERVMIGRIELVTDRQLELLRALAHGPVSDNSWVDLVPPSEARERFLAGRTGFGPLGVEIPPDYQAYLDLGRFRNALLTDRERRQPTPSLTAFVNAYGLHPYRWPGKTAAETASAAR